MLLVLSDKGKGMQSSSEQPLVGEEHWVTTLITAAKETILKAKPGCLTGISLEFFYSSSLLLFLSFLVFALT